MRSVAAFCMVVGLADVASAQRNAIDIKLRVAGTTEWVNFLDVLESEAPARVEVGVFYERANGYGFSGAVHSVVMSNWSSAFDQVMLLDRSDSAQHPDGRQGQFNFGAQRQAAYTTGADTGTLRIAAANNTQNIAAGGISVKQNSPVSSGSLFDTSNPVLGFRFDVVIGARAANVIHTWNFSTPADRILNFSVYEGATSGSGTNIPSNSIVLDGAQFNYRFPTPGTCITLGAGVLCLSRRR